ncbi:hypothetical protein ENSA5_05330 [Enhygromyxa salina]|uniref:Endo-1,4-beta-xylanase A n=1 Tax=Enhygromyxa salina TaxID=215803 RepID=A0A2S9YI29_9BACT|nr:hypothetical protein [Enhygromyxa salina]PRQ04768.1 hypothetical protein ENSA5_05330 [Enhygromyxa salina]
MTARISPTLTALVCVALLSVPAACADDGTSDGAELGDTSGTRGDSSDGDGDSGDGDGDGDGDSGDGDGDGGDGDGDGDSGDGDGDSGDGDGDSGDGDGDTGDGDGDTGDGDGDTGDGDTGDGDGDSGDGDGDGDTGDGDGDTGDGDGDTGDGDGDGDPLTFDACGFAEDGPWLEVEYWQLGSVSSPSWSYSDTPGWTEPQWAWGNESWPEIFEFGNNSMSDDPIGIVASISGTWQIMIGLQDLNDYDNVSVCIEGRSISVGSSATMAVSNPLNDCGVQDVQISHSWEVHKVGVDLGTCLVPGAGTQAVRIEPWGGSGTVGLKRVRVTLHGAVY